MRNQQTAEATVNGGMSPVSRPPVIRKKKKDITRTIFIIALMIVPIIHFLIFTIYINFDTILLSFQRKNSDGIYVFNDDLLKNYKDFFRISFTSYSTFPTAIKNSIMYFVLNDVVIVPCSVVITYFLYKRVFMHQVFRVVFYLPCIVSMVVMIMSYRFMFDSSFGIVNPLLEVLGLEEVIPYEFGWLGTRKTANGVIIGYCIWAGLGGNFILLASAMERIPEELVEAGKMDGLGFFGELWSITIPLIGTTLATLYMMGTSVIFTFFLQVKLLTNGGPNGATGTIMLYIVESIKSNTNDLSGSATVGMLIALVGTPLVLLTRFIVDRVFPSYEY